ncbi:hypothetical protein ACROSR_15675 [Roseovarius tibetensis]|uniref:hypothetical protein n=1 Tax=Roseovarius tibetensis TaxID=2685897 RepID=UPI003D7F49CA
MTTVALAGRRPDSRDTREQRFPPENRDRVARAITDYLRDRRVTTLVCSAAAGADLLALEAAATLGSVSRIVVLPFDVAVFRESSVVDRPGEWGRIYDAVIAAVGREGGLRLLGLARDSKRPYAAASEWIIEEAAAAPGPHRICTVWEGSARAGDDNTMRLAAAGLGRGWPIDEILTLA